MLQAIEHQVVEFLTHLLQAIGWPGVVAIMTLESANIPIPSEVTMPLAGWMLVQARGLPLTSAIWLGGLFGAIGCTLGSVISYALGAWGGRPLVKRYGKWIMVSEEDLERADKWFGRWGDWAVFISRLLPIVRTFISFPAGVTRMNFPRFVVFSFIGSFIWCAALAAGGHAFGSNWEALRAAMRPFDIPIAVLILIGVAWYVYKHVQKGRARRAASQVAAED
jgi:membrane protein DedA with SNARE-associated domain